MTVLLAAIAAASVPAGSELCAQVIYVDQQATGANDGTSWVDAFTDLQDGLDAAEPGSTIRVADGTYIPTKLWLADLPHSATFSLVDGAVLAGGFAGAGALDPDDKDTVAHPSILQGELGGALKAMHVVRAEAAGPETVMDGFTITNGYGIGPWSEIIDGGGLLIVGGAPVIRNCTFTNNGAAFYGGGAAAYAAEAVFIDCAFLDNNVTGPGGGVGVFAYASTIRMSGCEFELNFTSNGYGGAILHSGGDLVLEECSFVSNGPSAIQFGGPELRMRACSFSTNWGIYGGGAISAGGDYLEAVDCTFDRNLVSGYYQLPHSSGSGGAIITSCRSNQFVNCRFIGNHAYAGIGEDSAGGGLYLAAGGAHIVNCTFVGNTCMSGKYSSGKARGAGIHAGEAQADLFQCTLALNEGLIQDSFFGAGAEGAGIFGNASLYNCILWGNVGENGADEAAQAAGSFGALESCSWQGWTGALGGNANDGADPEFVDADGPDDVAGTADDDVRLAGGSPCIDSGSPSWVPFDSVDLDGDGVAREGLALDLDRTGRLADDPTAIDVGGGAAPVVDRGAYEKSAWKNFGAGLAGIEGEAFLLGNGVLLAGEPASIVLTNAAPHALAYLCAGFQAAFTPFKGGTMVPDLFAPGFALPFACDAEGGLTVSTAWPADVPAGLQIYVQCWSVDAMGPQGVAASNAVSCTAGIAVGD